MYLYILKCTDNSYYTGVTNDLEKRVLQHQIGINKNCYTYDKRPVKLVYHNLFQTSSQAIEWEKKIKGWTIKKKEALINDKFDLLPELARCKNETSHLNHHPRAFDFAQAALSIKEINDQEK